jgi:hypothetical protein
MPNRSRRDTGIFGQIPSAFVTSKSNKMDSFDTGQSGTDDSLLFGDPAGEKCRRF